MCDANVYLGLETLFIKYKVKISNKENMMLKFNLKFFCFYSTHNSTAYNQWLCIRPHDVIEIIIYEALDIFWELFNSFACLYFLK